MRKTKTGLNRLLLSAGLALTLCACSTTPAPEDLGALVHTDFSEKVDGTAYHKVMGLSCPAEINGMPRAETHVYNDQGTDVSCNYLDEGRIFTVYLSRFPNFNLSSIFNGAKSAIEQRFAQQGYEFDEDMSQLCSSKSIESAALLSGFSGILSGENTPNEINISPSPSAVFTQSDNMTLVIVDEMFENEYFKTRYTGPFEGESSVADSCGLVRELYLSMEGSIKAERGISVSDQDRLLQLINAADDE